MNKILLLFAIAIISSQSAQATVASKYFDHGIIYSRSSFPIDVAKCADNKMQSLDSLKTGESVVNNILGLIETGDGSIETAARNGGITQIHYVDHKINKLYVPLIFIPVYVKQTKTIVYGE